MRVVLFLGAGFSKSAGFPLMREFSMFSKDLKGYEDHILCFHECINYAQRTRAYIHGDIYNIEYLMSVLSLAAITNPDLEFRLKKRNIKIKEALTVIKELVWRVYSRIDTVEGLRHSYDSFIGELKKFINIKKGQVDIITTNYDLLPEIIMFEIGHKATMPCEFEYMPLPKDYFAPPNCTGNKGLNLYNQDLEYKNLHKLHGSVNWFLKKNTTPKKVYCWDNTYFSDSDPNQYRTPFCVCEDASIPKEYIPLIVPPSMIKEYNIPVILKAWQYASKAIAKADKIIFIGYSFPPSDTIMKFFLGTSLTNNQGGCLITVIDKNTDAVKKSLEEIFVDDISKYRIELINIEFSDIRRYFTSINPFSEYLSS